MVNELVNELQDFLGHVGTQQLYIQFWLKVVFFFWHGNKQPNRAQSAKYIKSNIKTNVGSGRTAGNSENIRDFQKKQVEM